jgi:excisionase family DNA binding protein
MPPEQHPEAPRIYTLDEAAARMRMSRRYLQELVKKHPFYALKGRQKLFTDADLLQLLDAMRPHKAPAAEVPPAAAGIGETPSERALKLVMRQQAERREALKRR